MVNLPRVVRPVAVAPIDLHQEISYEESREREGGCEHTFATLLAQDPPSVSRLPLLLPRITSVTFTALKMVYRLCCYDSQDRQLVNLQLLPDGDIAIFLDIFASQGASAVAQFLAGAPAVKSLTVDTDFANLGSEDIEDMLASFPLLEELNLEGRCLYSSLQEVWDALTPIQNPGEEADILCPRLKRLTVMNGDPPWYGGDRFFERMLPMLRERDACGNRLTSLELELMEGDQDENNSEVEYKRLRAKYFPELKQVVNEVEYEYVDYELFDPEIDAGI